MFRHARGWTYLSRGQTDVCLCTKLRECRSGIAASSTGRVKETHAAVRDVGKRGDGQRDRHGAGNCTDAAPVRTLRSWCSHERLCHGTDRRGRARERATTGNRQARRGKKQRHGGGGVAGTQAEGAHKSVGNQPDNVSDLAAGPPRAPPKLQRGARWLAGAQFLVAAHLDVARLDGAIHDGRRRVVQASSCHPCCVRKRPDFYFCLVF